jgi:hypothetical protein
VRSFKEKEGLIDGNTLKYLIYKYTTETPENTTHMVTIKRAFDAVREELKNNKMPVEDFLILLGILYTLHAEETGVDNHHYVIKAELAKKEGRLKMINEVRKSDILLRAPRPRPQDLKEGKKATPEDERVEFYYRSLGVTKDCLEEEVEKY